MIIKKLNFSAEDLHGARSSSHPGVPQIVVNSPASSSFPVPNAPPVHPSHHPSHHPSLPPPPYTPELTQILEDLNTQITTLERSRSQRPKDKAQIAAQNTQVYTTMLRVSELHPDPVVRSEYKFKAEVFRRADEKKQSGILRDLSLILLGPIMLTGSVLLLAGGIISGTGRVLTEIGHSMTGSKLRSYKFGRKSASTSDLSHIGSTDRNRFNR